MRKFGGGGGNSITLFTNREDNFEIVLGTPNSTYLYQDLVLVLQVMR